jgi:ribA/ribD-fused uncharacterized protein
MPRAEEEVADTADRRGASRDGRARAPAPPFLPGARPIPPDNRILYFERDRDLFGFLSHFQPSPILLDGEAWPTVEHWYQAQKSDDPAYRAMIRATVAPGMAKRLAASPWAPRRVSAQSWFRRNGALPRADWADAKLDLMRRGDRAKFEQNPLLAEALLATGDADLVEDSRFDAFWGVGKDGAGLNWAGRVLMEVRSALRAAGA